MIVARPPCLGGHTLTVTTNGTGHRVNRCTVCRVTSAKPTFCMTRCKGSAVDRWAKVAKMMADNGVTDGGGHSRMLSGDVIWCGVCGSYADLKVGGLTEACTGKDTTVWKGGG